MSYSRVRVAALCLECGLPNVFEGMESAVRAVCSQGTECAVCGQVSPYKIISGYHVDRGKTSIPGLPRTALVRNQGKNKPRSVDAILGTTYGSLPWSGHKEPLPSLSERDKDFD